MRSKPSCYQKPQDKKIVLVIPARYQSKRFPGKPLADLCGKPILQWVYEKACLAQSKIRNSQVIIATDDERIYDFSQGTLKAKVFLTSPRHASGTDRVAEIARKIRVGEIFVNVQGDEPLVNPEHIVRALKLVQFEGYSIGTVMTPFRGGKKEIQNPHFVKVIVSKQNRAIYFSRLPIPYSNIRIGSIPGTCHRHIGLYVYDRKSLIQLAALPPSSLEVAESLEQLRALENGISIGVTQVESAFHGVDTPQELEKLRKTLESTRVFT